MYLKSSSLAPDLCDLYMFIGYYFCFLLIYLLYKYAIINELPPNLIINYFVDGIKQLDNILYKSGCFRFNNIGLSKKYSEATAKNSISDVPP